MSVICILGEYSKWTQLRGEFRNYLEVIRSSLLSFQAPVLEFCTGRTQAVQ